MPWEEQTTVSLRTEFVNLATQPEVNFSQLCQDFGISRKTGYKWRTRYRTGGHAQLTDQSRRPHGSPRQTPVHLEAPIVGVRRTHPAWGARKIRASLIRRHPEVNWPSLSTITAILRRQGLLETEPQPRPKVVGHFEMEQPNQLWQMDFKGHFPLAQGRCHPLTVLDDHSRFLLRLQACPDERWETVQAVLTSLFREVGLPERMLMDNGSPWGDAADQPHTILTAWLWRLDIAVSHGRPFHPQTQGKDERLHRTLNQELLRRGVSSDLTGCQRQFEAWRRTYNYERPHEALGLTVPAERYVPSARSFPERLPPIEYGPEASVRRVDAAGKISFQNHTFLVGRAFRGHPVGLVPTEIDGRFEVFFCRHKVTTVSLRGREW